MFYSVSWPLVGSVSIFHHFITIICNEGELLAVLISLMVGEIAWLLPVYHPNSRVSGCAHSPLSRRGFPSRLLLTAAHLQPFNPRPCSSFLSLLFDSIHFSITVSSFASVCGGTERLHRGNHTQTSDKHTPSCSCNVCADRKCLLSLTHTRFILTQRAD